MQDLRCVYPLGRKLDVVELTEHDLSRLDDAEFLNDTVIDFFAKYVSACTPGKSTIRSSRCYIALHCFADTVVAPAHGHMQFACLIFI